MVGTELAPDSVRRDVTTWVVPLAAAMLLTFGRSPMLGFVEIYTLPERVLNLLVLLVTPAVVVLRVTAGSRRHGAGLRISLWLVVIWVAFTVAWSPEQYWPTRTSIISIMLSILLAANVDHSELHRIRRGVLILAGIFSCLVLLFAQSTLLALRTGMIVSQLGLEIAPYNVIILPRVLYVLVLSCVMSILVERNRWLRLLAGTSLVIPLIIALATGGRGPLAGLLAALLVLSYGLRVRVVALSAVVCGIVILSYQLVIDYLPQLLAQRVDATDSGRFDMWRSVIATGHISLFGQGLQPDYPHNIFIEFLYNYGLVGLALFLVFLWISVTTASRHYRRNDRDADSLWVICLIVLQLTAQQFSFDIFYSSLWATLVLPLGSGWRHARARIFSRPLVQWRAAAAAGPRS